MKSTVRAGIGVLALAGLLTAPAAAQSLGEYARQQRAKKPPAGESVKEYTNDNLPTSGALSEVGQLAPAPEPVSPKAAAAAQKDQQQKAAEQKNLEVLWRAKLAEQKRNIAQVQRELDTLVRENKLRQAAFKNNTAQQAYGAAEFAASDQKYQAEITEKQQTLDAAKEKLEAMKNELRQAGLPASLAD